MLGEYILNGILETSRLLLFYEALLSLLQQLSQSKTGAIHLLDAGLFQAVKESQIFAADPDIGLGKASLARVVHLSLTFSS